MEARPYKIKWNIRPRTQLNAIRKFIQQDSEQESRKVIRAIITITRSLPDNPAKFSPDKYRRRNDGTYRAFEKCHCRVSYRILKDEIRIVQVRHTSRKPRFY